MEEPHGSPTQLFWPARLFCRHPGAAVLSAEYAGLGALLVGIWSFGKAESPIQLIGRETEAGSQTGRFPGSKPPQISALLFQPARLPHWEIT